MVDGVVVGCLGRGCRRNVGGVCAWALGMQFSVAGGVDLGSTRDCCLVSLLESRPLRLRRLQLNGAGYPSRYGIFTPGWQS